MAQINLPSTLGPAYWDKQKAALAKVAKPPATKLGDEIKALAKLHLGVDWNELGTDKLETAAQAQERQAEIEAAAKGKVHALAEQARAVLESATKFEAEAKKDKAFPKETLAAAQAVAKAAKEYRGEIDDVVAEARKAVAARIAALAAQEKKDAKAAAGKPGAESKSVKLVRSRCLDAIRRIKKPAPGAKPVRFVVVQGKVAVTTYMGPSVGPAQEKLLKGLIPDQAPFKVFKSPTAEVVWEKNAVTFVSDQLPAGLGKRMQLWLKQILKVNLKLRVRRTTGEVEEVEGDDVPDDLLKEDPAEASLKAQAGQFFEQRLGKMKTSIQKALAGPSAAEIKGMVDSIIQFGKARRYEEADAALDEVEAVLEDEGAESGGEPDAMAQWQAQRAEAVASIKAVAAKIAASRHPVSAKALIELNGVMKNLTPAPASARQVAELQRWLRDDDVVNDVCELADDFRTPLLRVLERLHAQLPA